MQYSADELLFKKVVEEMGIKWDETPGNIEIDGISADKYFEEGSVLKGTIFTVSYNEDIKINVEMMPRKAILFYDKISLEAA